MEILSISSNPLLLGGVYSFNKTILFYEVTGYF